VVDSRRLRTSSLVVAAWLLSACGTGITSPTGAGPAPATSPTAAVNSAAPLPTLHQGLVFKPSFTYTLPAGWTITHDDPAMFRFLPIGYSNDDYDAGGTEGISLITDAGAANLDCTDTDQPGVGLDPQAIAKELVSRAGIAVSEKAAVVGGLAGQVLDVRIAPGGTAGCPDVPLINSPVFNQRIGGTKLIRLYLLDLRDSSLARRGTLAIEIDDLTGGDRVESLSEIVSGFTFTK